MIRRNAIKILLASPVFTYITFPAQSEAKLLPEFNEAERQIIRALSPHMHLKHYPKLYSITWSGNGRDVNIDYKFLAFDRCEYLTEKERIEVKVRTKSHKSDSFHNSCGIDPNKIEKYFGKNVMLAEKWNQW